MPHGMNEDNRHFSVEVLADGNFVLRSGMEGYGYESVDELLKDLKADLMKAADTDSGEKDKRGRVKKIMEEDEDEEAA